MKGGGIQYVNGAMGNLAMHKGNGKSDNATAMDVNPDTADPRRARGWLKRSEIAAKYNEVDRACRIDYIE
jgi:hypothetical protein